MSQVTKLHTALWLIVIFSLFQGKFFLLKSPSWRQGTVMLECGEGHALGKAVALHTAVTCQWGPDPFPHQAWAAFPLTQLKLTQKRAESLEEQQVWVLRPITVIFLDEKHFLWLDNARQKVASSSFFSCFFTLRTWLSTVYPLGQNSVVGGQV